jgi:hypothetical protein
MMSGVRKRSDRFLLKVMIIVLMIPLFSISGEGSDTTDRARILLDISMDSDRSGSFSFLLGNVIEGPVENLSSVPEVGFPNRSEYLNKLLDSLTRNGNRNETVLQGIIDGSGRGNFSDITIKGTFSEQIFLLIIECNFTFRREGLGNDLEYLDFLDRLYSLFDLSNPRTYLKDRQNMENFISRIKVEINIHMEEGLSITSGNDNARIERGLRGEELHIKTDALDLTRNSNRFRIFQGPLTDPLITFIIMITVLLLGTGSLSLIWIRNRFKGPGLIIPLTSLVFIPIIALLYLNPGLSIYPIGPLTLLIPEFIFLILITTSLFFNPRPGKKIDGYDDERNRGPRVKMPEVVFVEKKVYIEKNNKGSKEENVDPYKVLEIPREATWIDVERSYREKIKQYHPDKYERSPEMIKKAAISETEKLNIAYERLKTRMGP